MSKKRYKPVDVEAAAREFRKRNIVFVGTFLAGVLGLVIFGDFLRRLFGQNLGFVGLLWAIAIVITGTWRIMWSCPRCGKKFFYKWWYKNAVAMKCVHCGFRP